MSAPNHSLTILIVDDNATDRETYRRYLREASDRKYAIVEAESGEQGLQLCRRQNPDVILLDFLLPDYNGLEFFTELKAQANGSTPAVVMLTGLGNERVAVQAIKSGIQDYLVKEETNREDLQQAVFSAWEANYLRQELQKSEERFRTSVENLMDCFGIYSSVRDSSGRIVDFRIEYVNRSACEANRMTQEQQIGKKLCELLPAHRETGLFDEYCQVVETGRPLAKDFCFYSDEFNGEALARFFDIRASKLGDGFVASWRDVTEQKRIQKALKQQARLIELTSEAIIARDADSAIATWNRGAEEMYGWTKEEATGKIAHTFLQTQIPHSCEEIDAILLEQGHWEGELIHTRKDGTQIVVESRQVIVRDEAGKPIGFLEVNRNISDRKRVEETLRQSEQRFRAIFNTTFQFIGLMQLDGTLIEANQTALDFGGLQLSDVIGRPFWEAQWWSERPSEDKVDKEDKGDGETTRSRRARSASDSAAGGASQGVGAQGLRPPGENKEIRDLNPKQEQLREAIQRAARGEFVRYEVEVLGAGNRVITIDFSIKPVFDETGQVVLLIPEGRDISDRIHAENLLKNSERRIASLAKLSPVGIFRSDRDGSCIYANDRACEITGLAPEQLHGMNWVRVIHPDDRERVLGEWQQAVENRLPFRSEYRYLHADGTVRWVIGQAMPETDEHEQIVGYIGTVTDISDRQSTEQRLLESEERLQLGMRVAGFAIAKFDYATNTVELSPQAAALYGLPPSELVVTRSRIHATFYPEERSELAQIIERVIDPAGSGWFERDHRVVWPNGEVRWLSVRKQVFFDRESESPRPIYAILAAIDISDRKQVEQDLQESKERLIERNQELDRFTHTVSHDLKAPLRAISNLAQWIEDDLEGQLDEENQQNLKLLRQRVDRMDTLINGLLTYSKIGRTQIASETVNVGELISEIIDSLAPPPSFTISVRSPMPTIVTKRLLLSQVFSNLISNAIKHCDPRSAPGGNRTDGRIEIGATQKGKYYEFSVADNGIGIAPENHDRIFGIFQTIAGRDTKESTGIGLSIVKKIIETEGGAITLDSQLGEGATFRFTWLNKPLSE